MEPVVFVDPAKTGTQVVGVTNQEAAGILREARETHVRVEAYQVFGSLDDSRDRAARGFAVGR